MGPVEAYRGAQKPLLLQAYEKIAQQDALIAALREELARLKELAGRS